MRLPRCSIILLCFYFVAVGPQGLAQEGRLEVGLQVNSSPSAYPQLWSANGGEFGVTVNNPSPQPIHVLLTARLLNSQNAVVAEITSPNGIPITLMPGMNQLQPVKHIDPQQIVLMESLEQEIRQTGKIPAGQYDLCVQVWNEAGNTALSEVVCNSLEIHRLEVPQLLSPENETSFTADEASDMVFQWSVLPLDPLSNMLYRWALFEVKKEQTPNEAILHNTPLVKEVILERNRISRSDNWPSLSPGKYAWAIQVLDQLDESVVESTPAFSFTITTEESKEIVRQDPLPDLNIHDLKALKARQDSLHIIVMERIEGLILAQEKLDELQQELKQRQHIVDSLLTWLNQPANVEEMALERAIAALKADIAKTKQDRKDLNQQLEAETVALATEVERQKQQLESFKIAESGLQVQVNIFQKTLAELEEQLYQNTAAKEFLTKRQEWCDKAKAFIAQYVVAEDATPFYQEQDRIYNDAVMVLAVSDQQERHTRYEKVFSDALILQTYISSYCNSLEDSIKSVATEAAEDIKAMAREMGQKLNELKGTGYIYPVQIARLVDSLRNQLQSWEAELNSIQESVATADKAYQAALENQTSTLAKLDSDIQLLTDEISNLEQQLNEKEAALEKLKNRNEQERQKFTNLYQQEVEKQQIAITGIKEDYTHTTKEAIIHAEALLQELPASHQNLSGVETATADLLEFLQKNAALLPSE